MARRFGSLAVASIAYEFAHRLRHGLGDTDTIAMEPVGAMVASNVEFRVVVRRSADAVQFGTAEITSVIC